MKGCVAVLTVVLTWVGTIDRRVSDNEVRLSVIEASRFRDVDAAAMERRIMSQLTPAWLKDDIIEIKQLLRDMDTPGSGRWRSEVTSKGSRSHRHAD